MILVKKTTNSGEETPQEFAIRLKLPFKDSLMLDRAMTHRSFLNEHPEALEDNERLEFLGDAVLDFLVAAWLYNRYPEMPEGDLTRMRSALVHTEQLAEFARKINLGKVMRLGKGEDQNGGRDRPALLCDTFEALVGALYLESGMESVKQFMNSFLDASANEILLNYQIEDPKSLLQEWAQSRGLHAPIYRTKSSSGPEHEKVFYVDVIIEGNVYGSGKGRSKQSAAKAAAREALQQSGVI
jgi:ribonuclease-3